MVSCSWRLLCAAVCLAGAPAAARAQEPTVPKRLVLVVYEKGAPDPGLVDGFLAALAEIDGRTASMTIVGGREVERRPEPARADAVVACGADIRCIAAVGEKAGATHVLFGRATAQADEVSMQWLLVSVSGARIVGKFPANLTDATAARTAAAQMAHELLGVTAAEVTEPPAGTVASGRPDSAAVAGSQLRTPQRSIWRSPRVVGGVAAIASGVVLAGVGIYYGQRSRRAVDDIVQGPGGSLLVAKMWAEDRARADAGRASVLLTLGGLLVASGGVVWASEWMGVAPVISVDADARIAGLSVVW